jgi:hypothetical protein
LNSFTGKSTGTSVSLWLEGPATTGAEWQLVFGDNPYHDWADDFINVIFVLR